MPSPSVACMQQGFDVPSQLVIVQADLGQERAAIVRFALQGALAEVFHALPALGSHAGMGGDYSSAAQP